MARPDLHVEILGVNAIQEAAYSSGMTEGRTLPWLQDTPEAAVWTNWNVNLRDFRILDSQNRLYAVFNLTQHDLSYSTNRDTLRQLLLQAAQSVNSSKDSLPDDWKLQYFGSLSAPPSGDPDADGADNFTEYAFGTNPTDAKGSLPVHAALSRSGTNEVLTVRFRRRAGAVLDYFVETSPDLTQWTTNAANLRLNQPPRNLFDGTGTSEVAYTLTWPAGSTASTFLRVRAAPR